MFGLLRSVGKALVTQAARNYGRQAVQKLTRSITEDIATRNDLRQFV